MRAQEKGTVLNEKICKPAGMKNTRSDITAEEIENRAVGYTYNYFTEKMFVLSWKLRSGGQQEN